MVNNEKALVMMKETIKWRKDNAVNGKQCKFTTDALHSPTLVKGNCPLSLLVCLVTTRLSKRIEDR